MTRFTLGDPTSQFLQTLIDEAEKGDAEAGLELIESIITELYGSDSDLLHWHAKKLEQITKGVPAGRALCVEAEQSKGRPAKWDPIRMNAVDQLLRRFADMSEKKAAEILEQQFGIDERTLRGFRKQVEHDLASTSNTGLARGSKRYLISAAGDYVEKIKVFLKS